MAPETPVDIDGATQPHEVKSQSETKAAQARVLGVEIQNGHDHHVEIHCHSVRGGDRHSLWIP